jgi:hypothetical protein
MGNEKTKVWLFSSENLNGLIEKKGFNFLFNFSNVIEYPINNDKYKGCITLIDFYSALINDFEPNYKTHTIEEIDNFFNQKKAIRNSMVNDNNFYYKNVYKLITNDSDQHVFLTRCFPDKIDQIDNSKRSFWLEAYVNTVSSILTELTQKPEDLDFFAILHKGDFKAKYENKSNMIPHKFKIKLDDKDIIIKAFFYSHGICEGDKIYEDIILKKDFFTNYGEGVHNFLLSKLKEIIFQPIFNSRLNQMVNVPSAFNDDVKKRLIKDDISYELLEDFDVNLEEYFNQFVETNNSYSN